MGYSFDSLNSRRQLDCDGQGYAYYSLEAAEAAGAGALSRLPRSLKILYENLLRHEDGRIVDEAALRSFAMPEAAPAQAKEIFFRPSRVLLNDSAGIPLMADFAALRAAIARNGGSAEAVNPQIPADLVVDHSVIVDHHGSDSAFERNLDLEFARNRERYSFLRWAQREFANFQVVPPGTGISHQVNLECLARGIWTSQESGAVFVFPETLLGTDSHTPMINSLGILGWGVGGIEAGAALLGQPVTMVLPRVVGCRLTGVPNVGVTASDIVLTVTERLRRYGVVAAFVEFFGEGLTALTLSDRATIANMAPEYGATMGFFPWDRETLRYLEQTARGGHHAMLLETYAKVQGLWHDPADQQPDFAEIVEIDLAEIEPSLAGPRRPQDRLALPEVAEAFTREIVANAPKLPDGGAPVEGRDFALNHGDIVVAAITSCTNTSNPSAMLAAGLLARNAVERGLRSKPWVKTSLAPGSRVVVDYLRDAGLQPAFDQLGFQLVGYGCATCMGNSGPLDPAIARTLVEHEVVGTAVLSGNRNFEGRVHPLAKANYIGSPLLVVAYALAGSIQVNLSQEPLGCDSQDRAVSLADIWPEPEELQALVDAALTAERFAARYANVFEGEDRWRALTIPDGSTYTWDPDSHYMREPPFFIDLTPDPPPVSDIQGARVLALLGDGITTDHISPVGTITAESAAGRYLQGLGIPPNEFNSFAARRVNHEVMIRGGFANIRLRNEMADGREGGWTRLYPSGELVPVHEAAAVYASRDVPLVVIAGAEYGAGSSRDWAAKVTYMLGVRAVIAEDFERIHRSNLIGMGVLPLQFLHGESRKTLALDGSEVVEVVGLAEGLAPRKILPCRIVRADGSRTDIELLCRLDTLFELDYYRHGGILHYVARQAMKCA